MYEETYNTIDELGEVAQSLNTLLADEYHLYVTTRRAQHEIKEIEEINYNGMNKFFENQYEVLEKIIQSTDKRVRSVGRVSPDSLDDFLKLKRLNGSNKRTSDRSNIINKLLDHNKLLINLLRKDIITVVKMHNDSETASFLSELLVQHEKIVWMLESHLP